MTGRHVVGTVPNMPQHTSTAKTSAKPKTMTGLAGWVEVFRAGRHTDSKGCEVSFSAADLDQMAANHALGAAPAVIGHPKKHETVEEKSGAPAYAWTAGYKREGDLLFAKFADINPAFENGVKSGAYRNRSLSVFKDPKHGWRVRHVGWLGAEPPAIDGLSPVEFAGNESDSYEFSAPGYSLVWGMESIAKLLRGLRERIVEKEGIEAADAALPQWQIDSALEAANTARTQFQEADTGRQFSQSTPTGGPMPFTQEQLDAAKAEAAQDAKNKVLAEFAAKEAELIKLKSERQAERISALIGGWKAAGKVLPAEETGLAEFMCALEDAGSEFSFSASDGADVKKTPVNFFVDFMSARAPLVKLNQRIDNEPAAVSSVDKANYHDIARAANEFQAAEAKAGREISIDVAVAHVMRGPAKP